MEEFVPYEGEAGEVVAVAAAAAAVPFGKDSTAAAVEGRRVVERVSWDVGGVHGGNDVEGDTVVSDVWVVNHV